MVKRLAVSSARTVETLSKAGRHTAGDNIYLSITKTGSKRWVFLYSFGAKRRKLGLGSAAMGFEASGLIVRDDESETILVRDYYKANRPANQKHVVAIRSQITSITCSDLREEAESALAENSPTVAAERAWPQLLALRGRQNLGRGGWHCSQQLSAWIRFIRAR